MSTVMATSTLSVEKFPNFLPLRNQAGRAIALFSDYGSWLAITWGIDCLIEIRDTISGKIHTLDLASPLHRSTSYPDRQEAELLDGRLMQVGFCPGGNILIEIRAADGEPNQRVAELAVQSTLPYRIENDGFCARLLVGPDAKECAFPPSDQFAQNRRRWNDYFERAFANMERFENPTSQILMARGVATMLWNLRAPMESLPHYGVIPSPFYHRGYWAWDSWKHAHALAYFAPELAAEQLRAQFHRQQSDGMVPDNVKPDLREDNWCNSKPPMAAWALLHIWQQQQDIEVVRELFPKCAEQLKWWMIARRMPGEVFFRPGGVDYLSATWESGWDLSHRFKGVDLVPHGSWRLFDLWLPDLNTYICNDFRALAQLAEVLDLDPTPWQKEADQLADAIRRALWNEAKGCFCDVRASNGASTGLRTAATWIPLWANIATEFQKKKVVEMMLSPNHFWTQVPFPSLSASEKEFDPNGFWDGSVWNDHAAMAFQILGERSSEGRDRMRDYLYKQEAYFECYSPLDGVPARGSRPAVPQFSWGAAAALEVLRGGPKPAPQR
jgi:putative isomerase